jgi:hypothetical protein
MLEIAVNLVEYVFMCYYISIIILYKNIYDRTKSFVYEV